MKRDACYYFSADVRRVYDGFLAAAQNPPFERTCSQEPYYKFQFGLNFSFKYNMNGGSLTLRFIPYNNGTAVNFRFSIAQAVGARYEKYAEDLVAHAVPRIGVMAQPCNIDVEAFLNPINQVSAFAAPAPAAMPAGKTCVSCGCQLNADAKFCMHCGAPQAQQQKPFCSQCGAKLPEGAQFCSQCGTKLGC